MSLDRNQIDWEEFGGLMRGRRAEKRMSQTDVAHVLGISQPAVSLIERGTPTSLTDDRLSLLLSELDISELEIPYLDTGKAKAAGRQVFVSYSHKDKKYLDRLLVHLRPLQRQGLVDAWVDTKIGAGQRWKSQITKALKASRAAILLVSADFLASDFIVDNELPPLLKDADEKGTIIIPVVLKPCRFTREGSLAVFQSINSPEEPISGMDEHGQELVYDAVAERIESLFADRSRKG